MAARSALDAQIDALYQAPLDEFTAARNALARSAGPEAPRVRALTKPPVPAWAVNQLYWKRRPVWDALIAAADAARRTHKAVLSGRAGDIRAVTKVHDEAIEAALKEAIRILCDAGNPVTDATRQALQTTIRALPADDPPGRLTRTLQPGGFEALAGLSVAASSGRSAAAAKPAPVSHAKGKATPTADAKAVAKARAAAESAERDVREAEQAAHRIEFENARATREEQRATDALARARDALERAERAVSAAEADLEKAREHVKDVKRRAEDGARAVRDAHERAEAATAELKRLT
jgi:hypothetical protein